MATITDITAREILDSRGNPTLEVTVHAGGSSGTFAVPSGASRGTHEALELRDGDPERFGGLGVRKAAEFLRTEIRDALVGCAPEDQAGLDAVLIQLDGTAQKSRLGGNAILGASIASAKAAANANGVELFDHLKSLRKIAPLRSAPYLYLNLMNGGQHAAGKLAFQEYHVVPQTEDPAEAVEIAWQVARKLRENLRGRLGPSSVNIGDEGGFVPTSAHVEEPLLILADTLRELRLTERVRLALDCAASSFYHDGKYAVDGKDISPDELLELYRNLQERFVFLSIEDPFEEEDFGRFAALGKLGTIPVGDDLTVTRKDRLEQAVREGSVGGVIIKPNQVGTLTETLDTIAFAHAHGVRTIVSHRSGETGDDFIADLAVAVGAFGLKAGALQRGERVAKYNRLLQILGGH